MPCRGAYTTVSSSAPSYSVFLVQKKVVFLRTSSCSSVKRPAMYLAVCAAEQQRDGETETAAVSTREQNG